MLIDVPEFTWAAFIVTMLGCAAGIGMLSLAFGGHAVSPLTRWERVLLGVAALPTIAPGLLGTLLGFVIASPVMLRQILAVRATPRR